MSHLSENCCPLAVVYFDDIAKVPTCDPAVYLINLPSDKNINRIIEPIDQFCKSINDKSVVCILADPFSAATLAAELDCLNFQHWVAIKSPITTTKDQKIPTNHKALLIMSRYKGGLIQNKTRISYTYCPYCDKTTKDYGGKKHTFNAFGTTVSDVWRDIEVTDHDYHDVLNRIRDLFGVKNVYNYINVINLNSQVFPDRERINAIPYPDGDIMPNNLIRGDCLEVLSLIPSNSIDFCFVDPPYNICKKYDHWDDGREIESYFQWCDQWINELYRVLKPGRTLAILNIPQSCIRHFKHLKKIMTFQSWIAWDGLGQPMRKIMPAHYGIVCFAKGIPRQMPPLRSNDLPFVSTTKEWYCLRGSCISSRKQSGHDDRMQSTDLWWDIHRVKHNSRRVDHPCQLPPMLMKRLYSIFTKPGEVVLDCFNGAGTSTLAAQQMDRGYIGVELSEDYHALALKRHEQLDLGIDPFGKVTSIPKSKNSTVERTNHFHYKVPKKDLQIYIKRLAEDLGRSPTRDDVMRRNDYPIEYFDTYFHSWSEVCAAVRATGMTEIRLANRGSTN